MRRWFTVWLISWNLCALAQEDADTGEVDGLRPKESLALRQWMDQWFYFVSAPDTIDFDRLVDREGVLENVRSEVMAPGAWDESALRGMDERMLREMSPDPFDDFEILATERLDEGRLQAQTRLWYDNDEGYAFFDLWLRPDEEGAWLLDDLADAVNSVRLSRLLAEFVDAESGEPVMWLDAFLSIQDRLAEVDNGIDSEDMEALERDMSELLGAEVGPNARKALWEYRISLRLFNQQYKRLFRAIDRFESIDLGDAGAPYYRMVAHYGLENWDRVLESLDPVVARYGWTSEFYEYAADAHLFLGQRRQAERHAEAGLALNDNHWGLIMTFAAATRAERWPEIRRYINATSNPELCYEWTLDYTIDLGKRKLGKVLTGYFREDVPGSELIAYYVDLLGLD